VGPRDAAVQETAKWPAATANANFPNFHIIFILFFHLLVPKTSETRIQLLDIRLNLLGLPQPRSHSSVRVGQCSHALADRAPRSPHGCVVRSEHSAFPCTCRICPDLSFIAMARLRNFSNSFLRPFLTPDSHSRSVSQPLSLQASTDTSETAGQNRVSSQGPDSVATTPTRLTHTPSGERDRSTSSRPVSMVYGHSPIDMGRRPVEELMPVFR